MAVVKLSSSKKSIHFIDDEGNLFFTPVKGFENVITGAWNRPVLLYRMPNPVDKGKFKQSPVFSPSTGTIVASDNGYSDKSIKENLAAAAYRDVVIE
jgi:hypothetical protein